MNSSTPVELRLAPILSRVPTGLARESTRGNFNGLLELIAKDPSALVVAIRQQGNMPLIRTGDALVTMGLISRNNLEAALKFQRSHPEVALGELLVRMKLVTPEGLRLALVRKLGYPLVDVEEFPVEVPLLRRIGRATALRLQSLPLMMHDGKLIVALTDPTKHRAQIEELEFSFQCKVIPVLAKCNSIEEVIARKFSELLDQDGSPKGHEAGGFDFDMSSSDTTLTLLDSMQKEEDSESGEVNEHEIEQSDNTLVKLLNNMIVEASRDGVSDIHIESRPGKQKVRIRFRKDGVLSTYLELPPTYRSALVARIKIMCDLDISERRKPQDGKINFAKFMPGTRLELRVATIPTNNNLEHVVMRILTSAKPMPVDELGMSARNLRALKSAAERPYGMVLCVGPTGSGKTTTLHSVLSHINVPERKIWTAEDPVEITQAGLCQVQINPRIDWTFAKALRAFLRADPDVIMVGEIRDQETAQMVIEASLTGHLVLSTLHTNSAPETVTRLLDMGMDPFNFADSLLAVLAQRLVRRLCKACMVSEPASKAEVEEWLDDYMHAFVHGTEAPVKREDVLASWMARHGTNGALMRHHCPGCKRCNNTGFKGRAGLHELMPVSRSIRRQIQSGSRSDEIQAMAMAEGMLTLRQDGIEKMLAGITTLEEVRATSNA